MSDGAAIALSTFGGVAIAVLGIAVLLWFDRRKEKAADSEVLPEKKSEVSGTGAEVTEFVVRHVALWTEETPEGVMTRLDEKIPSGMVHALSVAVTFRFGAPTFTNVPTSLQQLIKQFTEQVEYHRRNVGK
mgnify:CR=1 FL=1